MPVISVNQCSSKAMAVVRVQGWDGTMNGHPQPAGVYVYLVVGSDLKGPANARGTVILVR